MTEQHAYLILNAMPGMGNRRIRHLVEWAGSARAALDIPVEQWPILRGRNGVPVPELRRFDRSRFLDDELAAIRRCGVHVLVPGDDRFPDLLQSIPDAPVLLYVRGDLAALSRPAVAIVGSRRCSVYGQTTAAGLAAQLADHGVMTISGMARGIDTAAHQGCLRGGMPTVAVLGSGLNEIYPPENARLYAQIVEQGAVISEFPMKAPPRSLHFPRRNRVVSGMSLGVVVVEAAAKSGALITADFALEQGRDVFAVPGRIDQAPAAGCLALLKQGAKLVTGVEDILEELALPLVRREASSLPEHSAVRMADVAPAGLEAAAFSLNPAEEAVLSCMTGTPLTLDQLSLRSGHAVDRMPALLMNLELKHCIRPLAGRRYVKNSGK